MLVVVGFQSDVNTKEHPHRSKAGFRGGAKRPARIRVGDSRVGKHGVAKMKSIFWWVSGFCAAAASFLIVVPKQNPPIELLAHRLEDAWADHHTVV
jgi:hypothetical protein